MRLATKFSIRVIVCGLLIIGILGGTIYQILSERVYQEVQDRLHSKILLKHAQIEAILDEQKRHMATLASRPEIVEFLETWAAPPIVEKSLIDYEVTHAKVRAVLRHPEHRSTDIWLLSSQGHLLFSQLRTERVGINILKTRPHLAKAFRRSAALLALYRSSFQYNPITHHAEAWVIAPVVRGQTFMGVLVFALQENILNEIALDHEDLGQTGETILTTAFSRGALFLTPSRHDPDAALTRSVTSGHAYDLPIQAAVQGQSGSGTAVDYRGEQVVATWQPVPALQGGIVVKMDTREAYATIAQTQRILLWIVLLAPLPLVGLSYWLARSVTHPLAKLRQITQKNEIDATPDFSEISRILPTELAEFASTLEVMCQRIQDAYRQRGVEMQTGRQQIENAEADNAEMQRELQQLRKAEHAFLEIQAELMKHITELTQVGQTYAADLARTQQDAIHLIYTTSRNIQEPLRTTASYIRLLQRTYGDQWDQNAQEFFAYVTEGITQMEETVVSLSEYCNVSLPRTHSASIITDTKNVMLETLTRMQARIQIRYGGQVTYTSPLPRLNVDPSDFSNLLLHLIEYGLQGEGQSNPPIIHIRAETRAGMALFEMQNNRETLSPQQLEHIFEMQSNVSRKDQARSAKLAICKRIVMQYGGQIEIEPATAGNTLKFSLPLADI